MRTSLHVLRWLSAGIFALILILATVMPVLGADTGTYRIANYVVTLEPQNNGQVRMTYEQQWSVLGGNIPWVTVGLSNSNFAVQDFSGAAARVTSQNSGGFTGVRVDLDKTYTAGQTFNVNFTILQNNLLERLTNENKWRINFTPGWYDQAVIDHLQIKLVSPVDIASYITLNPQPASTASNIITWEKSSLSPGSRFNVTAESTNGSFLTAAPPDSGQSKGGVWSGTFFIIIAIILVIGFLIFWGLRQSKKARDAALRNRIAAYEKEMASDQKRKEEIEEGFEQYVEKEKIEPDAEGRYYDRSYGGYITPAIWAAVILSQQNRQRTAPSSHSSCACACVSCACACACACAGGGAAGCARKTLHECPECDKKEESAKSQDHPIIHN